MAARFLHLHSTFAPGGKEARAVRLMNAFGDAASHVVVSAEPSALAAREMIAPGVEARFPDDAPPLASRPSPGRYRALARFMAGFDLVLTYNWGAMDAVMAHRLAASFMRLPPLIHHEDGFNADEAERQKTERVLFRRTALPAAHRLVVPSQRLEQVALDVWRQPAARIRRIANGVALDRYGGFPDRDAIPGLVRQSGEVIVGTLAGLRAVKNLPRLVRALAASGLPMRLVIVGEGPERERIVAEARTLGVADRLVMPGFLADPARFIGSFDIFALSSDSEQFPISLVEAMAAGLPVVATDVGDVRAMVSPANLPFIVAPKDEQGFAAALARLAKDVVLCATVGRANRAEAAQYDEATMIRAYRDLYGEALAAAGRF